MQGDNRIRGPGCKDCEERHGCIVMDKFAKQLSEYQSKEELENLKHQLFMENVRIQAEKSQIENDYEGLRKEKKEVAADRKQLSREKKQLTIEINQLREQVEYQRKRLREDERLLDQKQKLVERGYEMLEQDKKQIQREYSRMEQEREQLRRAAATARKEVYATGIFFRGINNRVALKKRYKDLLKIYHPDNICGDNEILLKINREYEELKERFDYAESV